MRRATFTIQGPPVGKQRARTYRHGKVTRTVTPTKTRDYEALTAQIAAAHWQGEPSTGPIRLTLVVVKARPKRLCRKSDPDGRVRCLATPDLDNVFKSCSDSLNGIVYVDDAQVVEVAGSKWYAAKGERPRVEVTVEEICD